MSPPEPATVRSPTCSADAVAWGYDGFCVLEPHLVVAEVSFGFTGPERFADAANALKQILQDRSIAFEIRMQTVDRPCIRSAASLWPVPGRQVAICPTGVDSSFRGSVVYYTRRSEDERRSEHANQSLDPATRSRLTSKRGASSPRSMVLRCFNLRNDEGFRKPTPKTWFRTSFAQWPGRLTDLIRTRAGGRFAAGSRASRAT